MITMTNLLGGQTMLEFLIRLYKKPRLIFVDILLINLSLIASFMLRFDGVWLTRFNYLYLFIISTIALIVFYFSSLYNRMWRYASIAELKSILKVIGLINLLFLFVLFFGQMSFSRSVIIINFLLNIFFLGGMRFFIRLMRNYVIRSKSDLTNQSKVLIVGAGDTAEIILREINKHPQYGKEIVGLVDDDPRKINLEIHGKKVIGDRNAIPEIIEKHDVSEVIIAIPSADGEEIEELYDLSNKPGVKVNIVPGLDEIISQDFNLNQIREVRVEDLLGRDPIDLNVNQISSELEGKTVLVTGGGGSIGSELCRQIASFNPKQLIIFDISENNVYFIELELKDNYDNLNITPVIGNVQDSNKLNKVFETYKPDVVFHAAAHKHVPLMEHNPEEAVKNNIFGTKNVAEISDKYKVEKFVLVSTDKAVNPTNVMGATKRVAEMIVQTINQNSSTKFMAVRFGNVLGSRGSVVPLFKKQISNGGPVTVTHEEVERYFMTIPEAVQLVIQAGALGSGGEVFVLDMGEPVKIIDLAEDLIKLSGLEVGTDIEIKIIGLRPGEKLCEELLHDHENDISTGHDRIFITDLSDIKKEEIYNQLSNLNEKCKYCKHDSIINSLIEIVKTYHPNREEIL